MASRKQNGTCCAAYGCKRKFDKNDRARFHSFPMKSEKVFKKWLLTMTREDFIPTKHSRICVDHFVLSYYYPSSSILLNTVFDFPQHLQKVATERNKNKKIKRVTPYIEGEIVNERPSFLRNIKLSPEKAESKDFIGKQKKETKTLKLKVRRY